MADQLNQGWPGVDPGYVVLPRSLAEGMSLPWQQQMAALLAQFHYENAHLAWPIYRVVPSRCEKLVDLDEEQLAEVGYLVEMDTEGEMIYRERSGRKIDDPANATVLVSCLDPIPKPAQRLPAPPPSQVAPPAPGQPPRAPAQMNIGPAPIWRTVTPPAGPPAPPPLPGTPSSSAQTPPAASAWQTLPVASPPPSSAAAAPPTPEAQPPATEAPADSAQAPPAPPPASAPSVTPFATGPAAPPAASPVTSPVTGPATGPVPQPVSPPSPPQGAPAPPAPEPATPPRGVPMRRGWFDELEGDLPESSKLDPSESGEFGPTGEPTEIPYRYRK